MPRWRRALHRQSMVGGSYAFNGLVWRMRFPATDVQVRRHLKPIERITWRRWRAGFDNIRLAASVHLNGACRWSGSGEMTGNRRQASIPAKPASMGRMIHHSARREFAVHTLGVGGHTLSAGLVFKDIPHLVTSTAALPTYTYCRKRRACATYQDEHRR